MQLQLAEAFALLVLDRPEVLQQVQLGSAGVVAQRAVVVAGLRVTRTLLFLQVLQEGRRCEHRWKERGREREREGEKLIRGYTLHMKLQPSFVSRAETAPT